MPPVTLRRFGARQEGGATLLCLFLLLCICLIGGMAVDGSNAWRVREILQSNAEAAASSAAIRASEPLAGEVPMDLARSTARYVALRGLSSAGIPDAWGDNSFETGTWDADTRDFSPGGTDWNSVRVTLDRGAPTGNPEPLTILRPFGYDPWNLRGRAVAVIERRDHLDCTDPLLSLKARPDVSAIDAYLGICLFARAEADYGARPLWADAATDRLIDGLLAEALGLNMVDPLTWNAQAAPHLFRAVVDGADRTVDLGDLDDISVISDGSMHVDCQQHEVLTLRDVVIENAAIFSDCPIAFRGDVQIRMSLVVSNLTSVLRDLPDVSVRPDAVLTGSPACAPGDGVRVLLFADVEAVAGVPALVSTDSPLGAFLDDTVSETGGFLSDVLDVVSPTVNALARDISEITTNLSLLPVCLDVRTMLSSDTVVLR